MAKSGRLIKYFGLMICYVSVFTVPQYLRPIRMFCWCLGILAGFWRYCKSLCSQKPVSKCFG